MRGTLRFDPPPNNSVVRLSAPVRSFGKIRVKGHYRQFAFNSSTENFVIFVLCEPQFTGVKNLVSVPPERICDFDSKVLVEEQAMHQSRSDVSSVDSTDSFANSIAARTSSSVRPGKPLRITSGDSPAAS